MANTTQDWKLYEAGKKYNNRLKPNYYDTVDTNWAFFNNDQWRNVDAEDMPKPVFNIITRVITFFVASLTSTATKVQYEPLIYQEDNPTPEQEAHLEASQVATAEVANIFELHKMEHRIRDALFDSAVAGDVAMHMCLDLSKKPYGGLLSQDVKGEIRMELVDGTNVMFGNANNPDTQVQPYIIIVGRDMVENLKEEAKRYQKPAEVAFDAENIQADKSYLEQAGDSGKIEVEADEYGKALYIIVYRKDKETGKIKVSKCVENAYIYKDINTGLDLYPVAWLNWEKQKNQYHGRALCTGMLPNQIFINRMFAMVMYHLIISAFPKAVYDASKIELWSNEIGTAIPVNNLNPGESIKNIASYLEPGNMSAQIVQVIELAIQYTKETLGISDVTLGNVKPDNTSAIIAVQKSSMVPLENVRGNLYEWIEDIGRILLDMMGTYYGFRPLIMEQNGQKTVAEYDFSQLKGLYLNVKADVGSSSYWSEITSLQTLDNLLNANRIDFVDWLERIPDGLIKDKEGLISKVQDAMVQAQAQVQQQMEAMNPPMGGQMPPMQG